MRLKTLLLIGANALSTSLISQDKYGPGYYLANGVDTVRGFVEYRSNYNYEFKFKKNLKEESKTFTIDEVSQFGLDYGITYRKLDFALDDLGTKPVFAQILIQGDVTLYRYQGRLFVDGGEKKKFLLAKGKGRNAEEVQMNYQKNTGIFNILFFDCPAVKDAAVKSTINTTTISNLLIDYHYCKQQPFTKLASTKKKQVKYGALVGLPSTSLSYGNTTGRFVYLERSTFNTTTQSPGLGLIRINRGRQVSSILGLQQELYFWKTAIDGSSYLDYMSGPNRIIESSTTSIKYTRLDYKIGPRITLRSNSINPYLSLGVTLTGYLGLGSKSVVSTQTNDSIEIREENPVPTASGVGTWASIGVGKRIKNHVLFIDTTLEKSFLWNSGRLNSFSGRLGFLF
jgi:hypothetical protein